jgi:hypothetical protein
LLWRRIAKRRRSGIISDVLIRAGGVSFRQAGSGDDRDAGESPIGLSALSAMQRDY